MKTKIFLCLAVLSALMLWGAPRASAQTTPYVNVTWNAYLQGSDPATGIVVQRSTLLAGPWTTLTASPLPITTVAFSDATGTPGTAYYYQVYVVDALGDQSTDDVTSSAVVFPAATPVPLMGITATPK